MKLNMYSIYDSAVNAYMRPFFCTADGQATRMLSDVARDPSHDIGKHPEDYALFRIGVFDEETGTVEGIDPRCVARAHELVAIQKELN